MKFKKNILIAGVNGNIGSFLFSKLEHLGTLYSIDHKQKHIKKILKK